MSTEANNKHGVGAFILAAMSFIPLIGVFIGIICIVMAVMGKKSNAKWIGGLGLAGIMFSVVLYGTLFYKMFNDDEFTDLFQQQAVSSMTSLVRHIEYYKLQNGAYPESMAALREELTEGDMVLTMDVSAGFHVEGQPRDYYYEVVNDGSNYLLFGAGKDATPFTEDDIFPMIDQEKDRNIGWVKSK